MRATRAELQVPPQWLDVHHERKVPMLSWCCPSMVPLDFDKFDTDQRTQEPLLELSSCRNRAILDSLD
jgi:hypothetical protein